jgi:hypothetical protein
MRPLPCKRPQGEGGGQQTKPALLEILQQEWVQCNGLHGPINQDMMLQHQMRQYCWVVLGCVAFSCQLTQSAWLLQVHVVPQWHMKVH